MVPVAMATGRPVLATWVAGTPELVLAEETGWLVPAGDAEALSAAILRMAQVPAAQRAAMGEAARQRVLARHDIDRADLVVVRFGDKYKQWNAAFDAGYCAAKGIPYITLHDDDIVHPLKEVDQAAYAWCKTTEQVVQLLRYVLTQA